MTYTHTHIQRDSKKKGDQRGGLVFIFELDDPFAQVIFCIQDKVLEPANNCRVLSTHVRDDCQKLSFHVCNTLWVISILYTCIDTFSYIFNHFHVFIIFMYTHLKSLSILRPRNWLRDSALFEVSSEIYFTDDDKLAGGQGQPGQQAAHQQRIFRVENPGDLSRSSPTILLLVECKQWNLCLTRHVWEWLWGLDQLYGLLEIYNTLAPIEYRLIAIAPLLFPKKWIFV